MTCLLNEDIVQATGLALVQFDPGFFPKFWALVELGFRLHPQRVSNEGELEPFKVEVTAARQALDDVGAALGRLVDLGREHTFHDFHLTSLVKAWALPEERQQAEETCVGAPVMEMEASSKSRSMKVKAIAVGEFAEASTCNARVASKGTNQSRRRGSQLPGSGSH